MAARRRSMLSSKENFPPGFPSTPAEEDTSSSLLSLSQQGIVGGKIAAMRERWDEQIQNRTRAHSDLQSATKESPTLAQLKNMSGGSSQEENPTRGTVYARQRALEKLHHEAKSRLEGVGGVGGGVSLWPAMDDMRLSRGDAVQLACLSLILTVATGILFLIFHGRIVPRLPYTRAKNAREEKQGAEPGAHVVKLKRYSAVLGDFTSTHPLYMGRGQDAFDSQVLLWHTRLLAVQNEIRGDFDVVWSEASMFDVCSTLLYISGICLLLYFLAENVFSKNRLTPRRIKLWVSLLCVVASWSILSVHLLACAQTLEAAMENTVLSLSNQLAELVLADLDLSRYRDVLLYWQTRYLQPASHGLLSVLGLLPVKDVSFYLHYYSLPILTALCTPIIKLVLSIKTVYKW